jgi:hypothetical protein
MCRGLAGLNDLTGMEGIVRGRKSHVEGVIWGVHILLSPMVKTLCDSGGMDPI